MIQNLYFNWIIAVICFLVSLHSVLTLLIESSCLPKALLWLCYSPVQKISDCSPLCKFFTLVFKAFHILTQNLLFQPYFLSLFYINCFILASLTTYCCSNTTSFSKFLCHCLSLGCSSNFTCLLRSSILFEGIMRPPKTASSWHFLSFVTTSYLSFLYFSFCSPPVICFVHFTRL